MTTLMLGESPNSATACRTARTLRSHSGQNDSGIRKNSCRPAMGYMAMTVGLLLFRVWAKVAPSYSTVGRLFVGLPTFIFAPVVYHETSNSDYRHRPTRVSDIMKLVSQSLPGPGGVKGVPR